MRRIILAEPVHRFTKEQRVRTLIIAGLVATAGIATLSGQLERQPADDMKALVAEVRALRLSYERNATATSQAQLLLGRVQLQENRLATLGRQYQEARTRLVDAQMAQSEVEKRFQFMTTASRTAEDAQERRALESQLADVKHELGRMQARTAQVQADETAALQALTTEQQRWSEFNERLEALERTLGSAPRPPR
jgi:valyl-tRNA synthetase